MVLIQDGVLSQQTHTVDWTKVDRFSELGSIRKNSDGAVRKVGCTPAHSRPLPEMVAVDWEKFGVETWYITREMTSHGRN